VVAAKEGASSEGASQIVYRLGSRYRRLLTALLLQIGLSMFSARGASH